MDVKFDYTIFPVQKPLIRKAALALLIEASLSYWV